jgi:hypothetical protein
MTGDAHSAGWELSSEASFMKDAEPLTDVSRYLDVLPDNTEVLVVGDVERFRDCNHKQGANDLGFLGTCGLVSCEDVLRQFGIEATETSVVNYAARHGLCDISATPPECGGTTEYSQAQLLTELGVPAHAEFGNSQEQLTQYIEEGRGVIIEVNAGELWNSPEHLGFGEINHAVVVTGVARDPVTGEIEGFYINDSGRGYRSDSGRFVDTDVMRYAWEAVGGTCVVTDIVRSTSI